MVIISYCIIMIFLFHNGSVTAGTVGNPVVHLYIALYQRLYMYKMFNWHFTMVSTGNQ